MSPEEMCAPTFFAELLNDAALELEQPGAGLQTILWQTLRGLHMMQAVCSDLMFAGMGNDFVGPFDLPAGDYRVEALFGDISTAPFSTLTRECESDFAGKILAAVGQDGGRGSLLLRTDHDCRVVVEVNAGELWTISFSPIQ